MKIINQTMAPRYERDRICSYLLVAASTVGAEHITTTLVHMQPGGRQHRHHHATEQCYTILTGQGRMEVDGEQAEVGAGDTVYIPANASHSLDNTGPDALTYISAGSPVFGADDERELWPLPPTG